MISIRFLVDHGYYRDIVYRNNLKNTIKTYRDITFSIIALYIHTYVTGSGKTCHLRTW